MELIEKYKKRLEKINNQIKEKTKDLKKEKKKIQNYICIYNNRKKQKDL